ncbi:MAG: hypothetical protein E7676_03865 [Ruminococcaceae bacterium]|nr:hypothetical protein [Oscillospiraceae bacterium]
MFKKFIENHSFSEYSFKRDLFPKVSDRAFWDAFQNDRCVKDAEAELNYNWPIVLATDFMAFKSKGDRITMENVYFNRRDHLVLFALAELKENRGRFLPQIVNGLFTTCEESYWGISAHWINSLKPGNIPTPAEPYIDLFVGETASNLAMICYLLEEPLKRFCPEILARVEYELEYRVKKPYELRYDFYWMGYHEAPNNWNPWIISNVLTVFLLTERSEARVHRVLEKMFEEIQYYYQTIPSDGGCDEGALYWNKSGATLFEFVYQLKQATDGKLNLFSDRILALNSAYMKKVHISSDIFSNIADSHIIGHNSTMPMVFGFARETNEKSAMNFSAAVYQSKASEIEALPYTIRGMNMRRYIYISEFLRQMESYPVTLPLHGPVEHLSALQVAILRHGEFIMSVKGGHNKESHNHNDIASFTLYDADKPILVDVGIDTYTGFHFRPETRYTVVRWTRTQYHNLPLVNGEEQSPGREFYADSFSVQEDRAEVSFAKAYSADAGIEGLTRTLELCDKGLKCSDSFKFTSEDRKQIREVLMSVLPVKVEDNVAILGDAYIIKANAGKFSSDFVLFNDSRLEEDWGCNGVTRIFIDAECVDELSFTVEKI